MPDGETANLARRLEEEVREQRRLLEVLDYIPTVRLINLLRFFAKVAGLSDDAGFALLNLVLCRTQGLDRLTNEELKDLVELLKAWGEAELETASTGAIDEETARELSDWLRSVTDAAQTWDPNLPPDQAAAVVAGLKTALVTQFPRILALLRDLVPEDVRDQLVADQLARMTPTLLRRLLELIVRRWLIRKFGEEVGRSLSGWVKVVLDLIELGLASTLLYEISDLAELIDHKLAALVRALADEGMGWPNEFNHVWFRDQPPYTGARVLIRPYVRCARREDGELVWSEPCPVTFVDGTPIRVFVLSRDSEYFDPEAKVWRLMYGLDAEAVDTSPCVEGCEVCYAYLLVVIYAPVGAPQRVLLLVGVRKC